MRKIPLSRGQFALIDDADFELVSQHKWYLRTSRHRKALYASAYTAAGEIHLHRFLLQPGPGQLVDHRDGNGLNNCRSNLRICNASQNLANRPPNRLNQTGYKGVSLENGRYRARVNRRHLGCYANAEDAARAYDKAALAEFGEFAFLNFPEQAAAV